MVRHVAPLDCELVARQRRLAGGEELRDAEHLLKSARMVARRRQEIFYDPMVPARGQIAVLYIARSLTIQNSADEKPNGFIKASLVVLHLNDALSLESGL